MNKKILYTTLGVIPAVILVGVLGWQAVIKGFLGALIASVLIVIVGFFGVVCVGVIRGRILRGNRRFMEKHQNRMRKGYTQYNELAARIVQGKESIVFGVGYVTMSNPMYKRLLNSAAKGFVGSSEAMKGLKDDLDKWTENVEDWDKNGLDNL